MLVDDVGGGSDRRAYLGVDYDEPDPATYRGVIVIIGQTILGPYASPEAAAQRAAEFGMDTIERLSSFDNFKADGGVLPS